MDLKEKYADKINIYVRIGSVRDIDRLNEVFEEFHPDVVFHAAAHKHVPLMEDSPCEAVKNNVFGTYYVAITADKFKIPKMVILSTDKAINPTNVIGTTKRITKIIVQYMNEKSKNTCYAAVRFGNVLGSHGSVIPIFKKTDCKRRPRMRNSSGYYQIFYDNPRSGTACLPGRRTCKGRRSICA